MGVKGSEVTGLWVLRYTDNNHNSKYHWYVGNNGRLYLCPCGQELVLEDKLGIHSCGYRKIAHSHKRNNKYMLP